MQEGACLVEGRRALGVTARGESEKKMTREGGGCAGRGMAQAVSVVLSPGPTGLQEPPSPPLNHHIPGGFAEVRKKWLCEGLVQRAEHKHPMRVPKGKFRGFLERDSWDCGFCEYGDKALGEFQLPSSNKEKEPEFGESLGESFPFLVIVSRQEEVQSDPSES